VGDPLTVVAAAAGAAAEGFIDVLGAVSTAVDALAVPLAPVAAADGLTDALAAVGESDEVPPAVFTGGVPAGAPARTGPATPPVGGFGADEVPLGATPTGLEIFLAP
jgi:hypothetical protein